MDTELRMHQDISYEAPRRAPSSLAFATTALRACGRYPATFWGVTALALLAGCVALAWWPKTYTSVAVIGPPVSLEKLNAGMPAAEGAAVAILGGLGAPSGDQTRYEEMISLLTSQRVAERLIERHHILQLLYPRQFGPNGEWAPSQGMIARLRADIDSVFGFPPPSAPDAGNVAKYVQAGLSVRQVSRSSLRTLSFDATTPDEAQNILTWLLQEADLAVRTDAQSRALSQRKEIEQALQNGVTTAENRVVLTELLLSTERDILLASGDSSFAAQFIDPPRASSRPTSPKLSSVLSVLVIGAMALGTACAVWRDRSWSRPA